MYDLPGAYVRDLVELAGRWKVAPAVLLADLPVSEAALADPMTRVPLRVCEAIVARALEKTGEPALAFHLGAQMRVSTHGFLGFAAMTAGTTRAALELAVRFAGIRTSAIGLSLYEEDGTASLVIEEKTELGAMREFAVLAIEIGIWQLGQALTGEVLDGVAECAFARPAYASRLPDAGRLRFECPANRLVFPAAYLELPLRSADAVATRLAVEQCERELASAVADGGLVGQVRRQLSQLTPVSIGAAAKHLHMSERTLKRKLADHGTTFSAIRDDMLQQRALLLLANRGLSIGEIATRLGYQEVASFSRAFRKWTGVTPQAHRDRER